MGWQEYFALELMRFKVGLIAIVIAFAVQGLYYLFKRSK